MELREQFERRVRGQVGSTAAPAIHTHIKGRGYRFFCSMEHNGIFLVEVYHPARGFYRATGDCERTALMGILKQVWLVDALEGASAPEVGPAADR